VSTALGFVWWPLLLAAPLLVAGIFFAHAQAVIHANRAIFPSDTTLIQRLRMRARIALLYRMQPLARFIGRYRHGLTPWRSTGVDGFASPLPASVKIVKQKWKLSNEWLTLAEGSLQRAGVSVMRGTDFDRWDLEVRGGLLTAVRVKLMTEDLGEERQLVRWNMTPRVAPAAVLAVALCAMVAIAAIRQHHHVLSILFCTAAVAGVAVIARGCGAAMATFRRLCVDGDF
jgi:hypothetical protein